MNRAPRMIRVGLKPGRKLLALGLMLGSGALALALTGDHPYTGIVDRNVFALKPPTPVNTAPPVPVAAPANVELRGITTLLGRPQVLLNLKVPARPPEPPKDRSLVMDVGQREGDVEVLEINSAAGSVRLRNQGTELAMNLKDNAAKPQFSGVPAAAMPAIPGVPGAVPPPAVTPNNPTPNFNPAVSAPAVPTVPSLPARNLRSTPTAASAAPMSAMEQAAIMEVERERTKDAVAAGKMPPLPPLPYSQNNTPQN